jgi:hypothetical protein
VKGYNSKSRKDIFYPNFPSAIRPVPHGPGIPVPVPPEILENTPVDSDKEDTDSDQDFQCDPCRTEPELFAQSELVRKLLSDDLFETTMKTVETEA